MTEFEKNTPVLKKMLYIIQKRLKENPMFKKEETRETKPGTPK